MRKLLLLCLFFIFTLPAPGAFPLAVDSSGAFQVEKLLFRLSIFDKKWNGAMQSPSNVTPEKTASSDDAFYLNGNWNTPMGGYRLTESLEKRGDTYYCNLQTKGGDKKEVQEISMTISGLVPSLCVEQPILLNDKPFREFTKKYDPNRKHEYLYPEVRTISIPLQQGRLIINGNFTGVLLQDSRHFGFSGWIIRLYAKTSRKDTVESDLQLQLQLHSFRSTPLDLRAACNMAFQDEFSDDGKGGWTDEGASNDMRNLPLGKRNFGGLEFDIIDPASNQGRSCIALRGSQRPVFPVSAQTGRIKQKGAYLYILHAMGWHTGTGEVGNIRAFFSDGTEKVYPVRAGVEVGNFWDPAALPNGIVAWKGENASAAVGLYVSRFQLPDRELEKISFESAGDYVWLVAGATLSDELIHPRPSEKVILQAGTQWLPIHNKKTIVPGSVLDFSGLLDAPAGKYGFLKAKEDKLFFEKRLEMPVRFLGANLCFSANFMLPEDIRRVADHFAALGYNSVRLHHYDRDLVSGEENVPSTTLDPEKLDRLELLVSEFKKRGIYVTLDLYTTRKPRPGELKGYPSEKISSQDYKALVLLDSEVMENWKKFAANLLTHVNPHTKLAWKDDPAIISICLINEGTVLNVVGNSRNEYVQKVFNKLFQEYLGSHSLTETAANSKLLRTRFLSDLYAEKYAHMERFMRKELGVKALLTDQNHWANIPMTLMRSAYELVDNHIYWGHPNFLEGNWWYPYSVSNRSAVTGYAGAINQLFASRVFGRPFTVTEWDFVPPNDHAAEGAFLIGAYGALQDWSGLWHFSYADSSEMVHRDETPLNFFEFANDPVRSLAERACVAFFLRRDVSSSQAAFPVYLSKKHLQQEAPVIEFPTAVERLGLIGRVGSVVETALPSGSKAILNFDKEVPSEGIPVFSARNPDLLKQMEKQKVLSARQYDSSREIFNSSTGELSLDARRGIFQVITPRSEGGVLPEGTVFQGHFLKSVVNRETFCTILASAVDGRNLADSSRILLLHLTTSKNSGMTFRDSDRTILEKPGNLPLLIRRGKAEITFSSPLAGYRLYAVDTNGERLREIPLNRTGSTAGFIAENSIGEIPVLAYELVKENRQISPETPLLSSPADSPDSSQPGERKPSVPPAPASIPAFTDGNFDTQFFLLAAPGITRQEAAELEPDRAAAARSVTPDATGMIHVVPNGGKFQLPEMNPAIIAGRFYAREDGHVLFGVGADWWFECFVNGQSVYSLLGTDGNNLLPIAPNNHIFAVPVRKGENFVSLYVLSGSKGWGAMIQKIEPTREVLTRLYPAVTHRPWLSLVNSGIVTVNFLTDIPVVAYVDYREVGNSVWQRAYELLGGQMRNDRTWHAIPLKELKPDTVYEYRTMLAPEPVDGRELPGEIYTFRSFTTTPHSFDVFFTSDTQTSPSERISLLRDFNTRCGASRADIFVHGGDVNSLFDEFDPVCWDSYADVLTEESRVSKPIVTVRGNHEYRGAESGKFFRNFASEDGRAYYAFRNGNTCFIVLDTGEEKPRLRRQCYIRTLNDETLKPQRLWLEQFVTSEMFQTAKFRIVVAHSPGYGETYMHNSVRFLTDGIFTGSAPQHRIHLWLCGHTHSYSRSLGPSKPDQRAFDATAVLPYPANLPFTVLVNDGPGKIGPEFSAVVLSVKEDEIEVRAMERDGKVFDRFSILPDGGILEHFTPLQLFPPVQLQ